MGSKKGEYIAILILLAICAAGTLLGIAGKVLYPDDKDKQGIVENPNKEFLYNNKLYFYSYGELLGSYQCSSNYLYCGWAYEMVDDNLYNLEYYEDGSVDQIPLIAERFAFISDNKTGDEYYRQDGVILYDVVNGRQVFTYQAVKNYTVGIENDLYIVKNNNKWGLIRLTNSAAANILEPSYDYIGLQDVRQTGSDLLVSDELVAMNSGTWSIIDSSGARLSTTFNNAIVAYDGQNVILVNGAGKHILYAYQGAQLLNGNVYNKIVFAGKYVGVFDTSNNFYLVTPTTGIEASQRHTYSNVNEIELEFSDNTLLIKKNGQVAETINI